MTTAQPTSPDTEPARLYWHENQLDRSAQWRSETLPRAPHRVLLADDRLAADAAFKLACEGTALLWRGDFQNARQLVLALARRADRKGPRQAKSPAEAFLFHRQAQAQRARTLGMVLIELDQNHHIALRRAPDVSMACREAFGETSEPYVLSLRELLGLIGAHEWRSKGVEIQALNARIHPHYGVFAPIRNEYIDLVGRVALPACERAFDIGTGTGVLAALLARRGIAHVIGTDIEPRALACAADNIARLGLTKQVEIQQADLFPAGRAGLIICNPPWLPARPSSALERAIFDPHSQMLRGFLAGACDHLEPAGEAWLLLSDLAERLTLRSRDELLAAIAAAGLVVLGRVDAKPIHGKAKAARAGDPGDLLAAARASEITSLWRLGRA